MAHHTYTQHPEKDPDKVDFPSSYLEYFKHVTSFSVWTRILENLFRHSFGKINDSEKNYIPHSEIRSLVFESRIMLIGYFFILLLLFVEFVWSYAQTDVTRRLLAFLLAGLLLG